MGEQSRMGSFAGLEVFAQVVEASSFTAAASRLGMAKSSVSETVRALENQLGVRLLDRTTRRVRPTGAGRAFYARCRRALEEAQAARIEAQAHQTIPTGQLRIAAPEGFARRYLVPGLPAFLAAHPTLDIDLVEGSGLVRLVEEQFDLAIRVARSPDEGLVVRRLATSGTIVVAAPGYLASHGMPMCPEDVTRHRCVGYSPLHWAHTWRFTGRANGKPSEHAVPVRPVRKCQRMAAYPRRNFCHIIVRTDEGANVHERLNGHQRLGLRRRDCPRFTVGGWHVERGGQQAHASQLVA